MARRSRQRLHRARDARLAYAIGVVPCFTPVRSPESNGIAEAFVTTFNGDYVRLNAGPDAAAVMAELDRWFDDYNK